MRTLNFKPIGSKYAIRAKKYDNKIILKLNTKREADIEHVYIRQTVLRSQKITPRKLEYTKFGVLFDMFEHIYSK